MNTLVVHPGALGDVILSRKALKSLNHTFPQNSLLWVGKTEVGNLLLACGEVHSTMSLEGRFLSDLFCHPHQWTAETLDVLKLCTHIVCWLNDTDDSIRRNLIMYGVPSVIIQSPYDLSLSSKHIEDSYVETLHCWQINMIDSTEQLRVIDPSHNRRRYDDIDRTHGATSQLIVIHPGSGSPYKCADPSLFALVIERLLLEEHRQVMILEGPADKEAVDNLCAMLPLGTYTVLPKQSLCSIAQYFSTVNLFIGNDSGLTHLAIACGVPSIVLFGPTDPEQWASRENHVEVLQGERCQCIGWSSVRCCGAKPCLNISVDQVVKKAEHWLSLQKTVTLPNC